MTTTVAPDAPHPIVLANLIVNAEMDAIMDRNAIWPENAPFDQDA